MLEPAAPVEVLAHRILWSLVFVGGVLLLIGRVDAVRALVADRRRLMLLAGAAVLIALNWGVYIYAVNSGHVIDAALGYFVNPLVTVALGVVVFGERLRTVQRMALALGTVAVVVLTVGAGTFPWIALVCAGSFGSYGLLKKLAGVGALEGLAVETLVLALPALAFLAAFDLGGHGSFSGHGAGHVLLLMTAGPVTAIPLALFTACVTRTPLTTVGLLQYITPVLQFLIGWALLSETMSTGRWIGFTLVWVALVVLTLEGLSARTARPEPRAEAAVARVP